MKSDEKNEPIIGIAWWRRDQWERLLEISEDAEGQYDNYDDWLADAQKNLAGGANGIPGQKVDLDVEELLAWCNEKGLRVNGQARAQYVVEVMRLRDSALRP